MNLEGGEGGGFDTRPLPSSSPPPPPPLHPLVIGTAWTKQGGQGGPNDCTPWGEFSMVARGGGEPDWLARGHYR